MKILVYGTGVIGTIYAARLQAAGHQVSVLARSSRLRDVQSYGLRLEDVVSGARTTIHAATVERLCAEDQYDLAIISVRKDQLSGIVQGIAANRNIRVLLFMLNNPLGLESLADALGMDRVLLGFPGAGGSLENHVVRYAMIHQQPTTVGEPSGIHTGRAREVVKMLRAAGFRTRIDSDMEAWLAAHAFFVTSVSGAIYLAGGDCLQLSRNHALLKLMVEGTREGFSALKALGRPIHPLALRTLFTLLPTQAAIRYWRHFFSDEMGEIVFARHARCASMEMRTLAGECRVLLDRSHFHAPALSELYCAIDDYASAHAPLAGPA
jgi:2-dehydropantoate 2-reductase